MADENTMNAVASESDVRTVDINGMSKKDSNMVDSNYSEMIGNIGKLEAEKVGLERENNAIRERMGGLTAELQELKMDRVEMNERLSDMQKKIEESESDIKATEAIAMRAIELETEVSRLQHDLISSMSEGEEANAEVSKLKNLLEEKLKHLDSLEKENVGLYGEVEEVKADRKSMVVRLDNERNEKARVEEEAKAKLAKKEREISELKKRKEELELVVEKNALELEKMIKGKKAEEGRKNDAVEAAKRENEKVRELEAKVSSLEEELDESRRVINELKENAVRGVNGVETTARGESFGSEENRTGCLKLHWPAVAVATGTVAAVTLLVYARSTNRR